MTQQTTQEEREWVNLDLVDDQIANTDHAVIDLDIAIRLLQDANTLARIREKNLLRSEVPEAPEDADKWVKVWRGQVVTLFVCRDGRVVRAPDYRENEPGSLRLAIVED